MEWVWYITAGCGAYARSASMIVLTYRNQVAQWPLLGEMGRCIGTFLLYVIPAVLILLPIRLFTKVPSFVFRKLLHIVAFTCVSLMILAADSWTAAALTSVLVAMAIFPLLGLVEDRPWYAGLFVEKEPGEIRQSLLMLFFTFAGVVAIAWGAFGQMHLAATAVLMWGVGDAVAALVGIPFGKHKVQLPLTDGKKSWEGSSAMFVASFACGLVMLLVFQGVPFVRALPLAAVAALAGTATELYSPSKYDTVTVPLVLVAVLVLATA